MQITCNKILLHFISINFLKLIMLLTLFSYHPYVEKVALLFIFILCRADITYP